MADSAHAPKHDQTTMDADRAPVVAPPVVAPEAAVPEQLEGEALTEAVTANQALGLSTGRVRGLQAALGVKADGLIGPTTSRAMFDFQVAHNLHPTGVFDEPSQQVADEVGRIIKASKLSRRQISRAVKYNRTRLKDRNEVLRLQAILGVTEDGRWGPETVRAVAHAQARDGLTVDGKVGPDTQKLINTLKVTASPTSEDDVDVSDAPKAILVAEPAAEPELSNIPKAIPVPEPIAVQPLPEAIPKAIPVPEPTAATEPVAAAPVVAPKVEETAAEAAPAEAAPAPSLTETEFFNALAYNRLRVVAHDDIVKIQKLVGAKPDGRWGGGTISMLAAWQIEQGYEGDGKMGSTTRDLMGITADPGHVVRPKPRPAGLGGDETGKKDANFKTDGAKFVRVVDQITSLMEGGRTEGRYDTLTAIDDGGGVSYGKHQATLTSGTLKLLLDHYLELAKPSSANRAIIADRMPKVAKGDLRLKRDTKWLQALRDAARNEKPMQDAQDFLFSNHYAKPAFAAAKSGKIASVLGHAIMYDTNVQGGLKTLMGRTRAALGGNIGDETKNGKITEKAFLTKFNDLREVRLGSLADVAESKGKTSRAKALRISRYRTRAFRELLLAGNLNVAGPEGELRILGPGGGRYNIETFDSEDYKGGVTHDVKGRIGKATVTAGALILRSQPSRNGSRVDTLPRGTEVIVVGEEGKWVKVDLMGVVGYLHIGYVDFERDAAQKAKSGDA